VELELITEMHSEEQMTRLMRLEFVAEQTSQMSATSGSCRERALNLLEAAIEKAIGL
jgi:hypothetical protein